MAIYRQLLWTPCPVAVICVSRQLELPTTVVALKLVGNHVAGHRGFKHLLKATVCVYQLERALSQDMDELTRHGEVLTPR